MNKVKVIVIVAVIAVAVYAVLVRLEIMKYYPKVMLVLIISVAIDVIIELVKHFRK